MEKPEQVKLRKKTWLLQIPLAIVIVAYGTVIIAYNVRDLGTLTEGNATRHSIPEVTLAPDVEISDETTEMMVYSVEKVSVSETAEMAEKFYAATGTTVDFSETSIYGETVMYTGEITERVEGSFVNIDYIGGTLWYDNAGLQFDDTVKNSTGAAEGNVRYVIRNTGIEIPDGAKFSEENPGVYVFDADGLETENSHYSGRIECRFTEDGRIIELRDTIIEQKDYKKYTAISEKEAYDKICMGSFYYDSYEFPDVDKFEITEVNLDYRCDSKGYYQPVYVFTVDVGMTDDIYICVAALK